MKYLVTGGAGFVGSNLVDELINRGNQVVVIDNLSTGKKENLNSKAEFYNVDVCDFEKIKPLFNGVDYVFHLAALPRVAMSVEDPVKTSKVNVLGTINVFKASVDAGVKRVIFYSSSAVYGNGYEKPIKENFITEPVSPYGLHKLVGEHFAKLFLDLYKLPIVCLRFFNIYGPRIDFDSDYGLVVGKFLYARLNNKPLTIFGDGKQTRDFCYVADAVDVSIKAAESKNLKGGEVINISGDRYCSINEIAEIIGGEIIHLPARKGDPLHICADKSLSQKLLNWKPKVKLEEGIEKTKEWLVSGKL